MNRMLCLLAALSFSHILLAQPNENWNDVNLSVTDYQVIPRYEAFDNASAVLKKAAESFCGNISAESLDDFRHGFNVSMDAWQLIQHVQFGPITYFNWNYRLEYWPDEKGTGARQLDALIAARDEKVLDSERFARESVGVQGFPALERLLFGDDSLAKFQADPYRCRVAQTIARNIAEIAAGVHQRWTDEFRTTIENADQRGLFESAKDATIEFLKSQEDPVRRVQQEKLESILGDSAKDVRTRRAESWRSQRSLRNIRLNVTALHQLFSGSGDDPVQLGSVLQPDDVVKIKDIFDGLQTSVDALPDSWQEVLAREGGEERMRDVRQQFDNLFEAIEAALKNTDLYLGFNSLDGD